MKKIYFNVLNIILVILILSLTLIGCEKKTTNKNNNNLTQTKNPIENNDSSYTSNTSSNKDNKTTLTASPSPSDSNLKKAPILVTTPLAIDSTNAYVTTASTDIISSKEALASLIQSNIEIGKDTNCKISSNLYNINLDTFAIEISQNIGYSGYLSSVTCKNQNGSIFIHFNYKNGVNTFLSQIASVNSKVKTIVASVVNSSMNDLEKEIALHDYVVNNTVYDGRSVIPDDSYTAYGLFKGVAVCQGYSEAMYRLLNAAGVKTLIVIGTTSSTPHAWNIVMINGAYYQLDTTFDDPFSTTSNYLSYSYFNTTDLELSNDHTWNTSSYPSCTSTAANYYIANNLIAHNYNDFYRIVKEGLKSRQAVIRCKTIPYSLNTFKADVIYNIIKDDPSINYVNLSKGLKYSYNNSNISVFEFYVNYK